MFDNETGILHYNYQLKLENIINAICNITFDIGVQLDNIAVEPSNEIEYAKELFKDTFFEKLSLRKSDFEEKNDAGDYNYSKDDFFSEISNYYNQNIFSETIITDYLKGSDILLINKAETSIYTLDEKKGKNRIIAAIVNGKILNEIIENIKNIKIRNSLNQISLFEHDAFYNNTIKLDKKVAQPILPLIEYRFINISKVDIKLEDFENYWINIDVYKKKYGISIKEDADLSLITSKANSEPIGLLIEEIIIPYSNIDLSEYINDESLFDFYCLLFKLTFSKKSTQSKNVDSLVLHFIKQRKDKKLNQLLSNLKNNLYLDNEIIIDDTFEVFFNKVGLIDKLDYLEEFEFIIPQNVEKEIALGIYTKEKKGTSYNLLHWLNHENDNQVSHFRKNPPSNKKKRLISTLKPEICFYFLEKYFEDLLEDIFKNNDYSYLSNFNLNNISSSFRCEVDFLVFGKNKFYYIEAKTKLSKFYIEDFLKKSSKVLDRLSPILLKKIEIEFILIGGYSDSNVKDFQYFIDSKKQEIAKDYNSKRENLNSIPYYFKVPIPDKKGNEITCIAEPEYDKLTKLILEICQK